MIYFTSSKGHVKDKYEHLTFQNNLSWTIDLGDLTVVVLDVKEALGGKMEQAALHCPDGGIPTEHLFEIMGRHADLGRSWLGFSKDCLDRDYRWTLQRKARCGMAVSHLVRPSTFAV
jgi:hypothetical protein